MSSLLFEPETEESEDEKLVEDDLRPKKKIRIFNRDDDEVVGKEDEIIIKENEVFKEKEKEKEWTDHYFGEVSFLMFKFVIFKLKLTRFDD
jgi:hypothetical protein